MNYFSTRDRSLEFSFKDIFLRGLAPGGGLFLPAEIKKYSQEELNNLSQLNYNELATEIIFNFCSCLLYTSPSPRDMRRSRMPSSA